MKRRTNLAAALFAVVLLMGIALYWYLLLASYERMRETTITRAEIMSKQLANGLSEQMAAVIRNINFVSNVLRQRNYVAVAIA